MELRVVKFVAVFEFTIIITKLLDSIVRKMNKFIAKVFESELLGACPEIAFFKKVTSHDSVMSNQHSVDSDVKLSFVYQQRVLYVTLYD